MPFLQPPRTNFEVKGQRREEITKFSPNICNGLSISENDDNIQNAQSVNGRETK
jgi:hypothetical protein